MIVLCAVLSGIEGWDGGICQGKRAVATGLSGIGQWHPPHDTLSDVLGRIDAFREAFMRWAHSLSGEQICLDGKTLRGSRVGEKAVHLLGAYAGKGALGCWR